MNLVKKDLYISNAINSKSNCVSWRKWLACGMSQSVVLIDQSNINANLKQQFTEHQSIVTCVSWISDDLLISADDSGNIIIWKVDLIIGNLLSFNKYKLNENIRSIVSLHGIQTEFGIYIACSYESYVDLIMYDGDFHSILHISTEPCFIISVNLLDIYESIIISVGLDDGRVLCYLVDINTNNISIPLVLTGHEDWVIALNSIKSLSDSSQIAYLASSSQDSFIRVWKISSSSVQITKENNYSSSNQLDVQRLELSGNIDVSICLDGVLAGHENWVTSVNWCERETSRGGLMLVSTSMDKSVIVWSRGGEDEDGQWIEEFRLGQIGGNTLGFIGGSINHEGNMIIGFGYQGDCVVYYYDESDYRWSTVVNAGGHFDVVEDIAWESENGKYLISVSKDQTVRLHAPWIKGDGGCDWQEIARPQIHGYDMTSVASIDSVTFITGADEKISRVFGMNKLFNDYFKRICHSEFDSARLRDDLVSSDALGLSNKSVGSDGDGILDFISSAVPKEENICGHTLWPEITKLYGHVYEVFRISCHTGMKLVATTCKALVPEYADIILWNTESWTIVQRLPFHKSTVVRVQFNQKGDKMVSVSKDRQWALWKNTGGSETNFQLINHSKKPHCHSKIIWDVDWSMDDRCFATVSRDKRMMLWDSENGLPIGEALVFKESVNAISTLPVLIENFHIFAVGLENGEIKLVQFDVLTKSWSILLSFIAHYDWITRLRFNPCSNDKNKFLLASCSKDRFVKIFEISNAE